MTKLVLLGTVHRDPAGKRRLLRLLEQTGPAAISLEVSPASVNLRREYGKRWSGLFRERLRTLSRRTGLSPGALMARPGLRGVFEYLRLPYEYRAALTYARSADRPLFLLDDPELASSYLRRVETEILTQRNIDLLAEVGNGTLAEEVQREYALAESRIFRNHPGITSKTADRDAWEIRETRLSQKLRLLHQGLVRMNSRTSELATQNGGDFVQNLIVAPEAVTYVPETVRMGPEAIHLYIGGWEHLVGDDSGTGLFSRLKDLAPERMLCFRPGPDER